MLTLMFGDDHSGTSNDVRLRRTQSAVPHAKGIHGHTQQCRKLLLRESDLS